MPGLFFFIQTDFKMLTAFGYRFANLRIAKRFSCITLLCGSSGWNDTSRVCFDTRIIYAWQDIRNYKRSKLNLGKLISLINSINDSDFNNLISRNIQGFALIRAVLLCDISLESIR